jgi:hypothetical protein
MQQRYRRPVTRASAVRKDDFVNEKSIAVEQFEE